MNAIEERILRVIDQRAEDIIGFAEETFHTAEAGFCEARTAARVAAFMQSLGLQTEEHLAVTGVRARIGRAGGPVACVIGELDGIYCKDHPFSDRQTGMSHACGHHMQLAVLLGAACALSDPQVLASLDGAVDLLAVPAEEHVGTERRKCLMAAGKIYACCGKSELLCNGALDNVDLALTTHAHMVPCDREFLLGNPSSNGYISKTIRLLGKASHAAIAPHEGVNALDAASLGFSALGMLRSTFREQDYVRAHFIMTKGGTATNVVPDEVVIEGQVRAKTMEAMRGASEKVNRAFQAGAYAFGARAELIDEQGYLPVRYLAAVPAQIEAAKLLRPEADFETVTPFVHNAACTDVGDLTHVLPVVNFSMGGFTGSLHSADFTVTDANQAYILPAKLMALTVYRLLKDGATQAREVMANFQPAFTRAEYREYVEAFYRTQEP